MGVVCNVRLKISSFDDTRPKNKLARRGGELTISCLSFRAGQRFNAAVTNGNNAVGVCKWRSAMGDEETGFIPEVLAEVVHHLHFGGGIEGGGCFIQNQNGGVLQQGAGQRQALPFARGKPASSGADGFIKTEFQGRDHRLERGQAKRIPDFVGSSPRAGGTEIVAQCSAEEQRRLRAERDGSP